MKNIAIVVALILGVGAYVHFFYPNYSHRYRLTIEVDTPRGVRSGSSVIQAMRGDQSYLPVIGNRYQIGIRGEAIVVDLGESRHLVALLAHGENVNQIDTLALAAFNLPIADPESWASIRQRREPVSLRSDLVPTLVTFSNLSDPKTVQLVNKEQLDAKLGLGVQFKRAWIEITNDPVTATIDKKMLWLSSEDGIQPFGERSTPAGFALAAPSSRADS